MVRHSARMVADKKQNKNMKTKLNGVEIETTEAKIAAVRFFCVFCGDGGSTRKPVQRIANCNGLIRCEYCGQFPHETVAAKIAKLLA